MSSAAKSIMEILHAEVADELRKRVASGEATAADISNAIKFLKDNGIEARADRNPGLQSLARQFPTFTDEDDEHTSRPN